MAGTLRVVSNGGFRSCVANHQIFFIKKENKSAPYIILSTLNVKETSVVKWLPSPGPDSGDDTKHFRLPPPEGSSDHCVQELRQWLQLARWHMSAHLPKTKDASERTARGAETWEFWGQCPQKLLTDWMWRKRKGKYACDLEGEHQEKRKARSGLSLTHACLEFTVERLADMGT